MKRLAVFDERAPVREIKGIGAQLVYFGVVKRQPHDVVTQHLAQAGRNGFHQAAQIEVKGHRVIDREQQLQPL